MNYRHKAAIAGLAVALSMSAFPVCAQAVPTQEDLAAAQERLEGLGGELSQLQKTLEEQEDELQVTKTDIEVKQGQVDATTVELDEARDVLAGRMRSNYKTGGTSLLSILLGSGSPEEIFSNIYIADKIATQDAMTIASVRDLEERLAGEVDELEKRKADEEAAIAATREQTDAYALKVAEAQEYYDSLDAEIQAELAAQAQREAEAAAAAAAAAAEQEAPSAVATAVMAVENASQSTGGSSQSSSDDDTNETQADDDPSDDNGSTSSSSGSGGHVPEGGGVSSAFAAIGSPYVWGAAGPSSFDCSGLVCYCYGYARGRTTYDMIASLQSTGDWHTDESELNYGDLVFTSAGHVGIYTGNHTMIDAPTPGQTVSQRTIWCTIYGGGPY